MITAAELKEELEIRLPAEITEITMETVAYSSGPYTAATTAIGTYKYKDKQKGFTHTVPDTLLVDKVNVGDWAKAIASQIKMSEGLVIPIAMNTPPNHPPPTPNAPCPVPGWNPNRVYTLTTGVLNAADPARNDLSHSAQGAAQDAAQLGQAGYASAAQAPQPMELQVGRVRTNPYSQFNTQSEPHD